ncbi:hypothetical protein NUH88_04130 [Nisaea acidiphila]|uniref:Uncharacterized protein n=1 Tax=Nisaea acidiphila TaxID=1862145 RepID=A0A9J7AVR1_9PROT|nr:hypothetical protein [Nisaea acidiphila]UUX50890.1 hypothetical protein NUH88_04130 [Nisaea acidiphila]
MARPKNPAEENERQVRVRAVADDERSGRFKTGDVFEMPFAKALLQMQLGKVEPVIEISDRRATVPEAGCTLEEAYRGHMRSYPEIAEAIDTTARTVGGLKFGLRYCRHLPKWPKLKPPTSKGPSEWDWREAARNGESYPKMRRRLGQAIPSLEVQFEDAMHEYRLQHARHRFFKLLSDDGLRAEGIPEDKRYEATTIAIPSQWWSWDIAVNIKKGEIHEILSDGKGTKRAWVAVQIFPPIKRRQTGRKQGGRPSSKTLIMKQFERRKSEGKVLPTLSEEAEELESWLANHHPDEPQATAKTIAAHIRAAYRAFQPEESKA